MSNTLLTKEQIEDLLNYIGVEKIQQWKGDKIQFCCPIHSETHPSCGINADFRPPDEVGQHLQLFNCFSCNASGSLVWLLYKSLPDEFKSVQQAEQFMLERYGVDYSRALSGLKQRKLHQFELSSINTKAQVKTKPMTKLAPFKSGKSTYTYFFKRGFDKEDMQYWKVGRDLESKTVTIPVFNKEKQLVGVIGRYIDPNRPKNSRYKIYDFQKGSILFPADKIQPIKGTIIVVEGMLDCMMLHKWGRVNTGALMGAKMTREQADFIAENCEKVILLFDNDTGGRTAEQVAKRRLKDRVDVLTCDYSVVDGNGKDPSEWGEVLTNKLISTASLVKHNLQKI